MRLYTDEEALYNNTPYSTVSFTYNYPSVDIVFGEDYSGEIIPKLLGTWENVTDDSIHRITFTRSILTSSASSASEDDFTVFEEFRYKLKDSKVTNADEASFGATATIVNADGSKEWAKITLTSPTTMTVVYDDETVIYKKLEAGYAWVLIDTQYLGQGDTHNPYYYIDGQFKANENRITNYSYYTKLDGIDGSKIDGSNVKYVDTWLPTPPPDIINANQEVGLYIEMKGSDDYVEEYGGEALVFQYPGDANLRTLQNLDYNGDRAKSEWAFQAGGAYKQNKCYLFESYDEYLRCNKTYVTKKIAPGEKEGDKMTIALSNNEQFFIKYVYEWKLVNVQEDAEQPKGNYGWKLIDTRVRTNREGSYRYNVMYRLGVYVSWDVQTDKLGQITWNFKGTPSEASSYISNGKFGNYTSDVLQDVTFTATCEKPPATIKDGAKVSLKLGMKASGEPDYFGLFGTSFVSISLVDKSVEYIPLEGEDIYYSNSYDSSIHQGRLKYMKAPDGSLGRTLLTVGSLFQNPPDDVTSITVSEKVPTDVQLGDRMIIQFNAFESEINWVYEYVDLDKVKD